jgi:hypothetical protein
MERMPWEQQRLERMAGAGHWDAWGQVLSLLCMAHCLLLPLALGLGVLPTLVDETLKHAPIHLGMVALALLLGAISLVPGFRRHRDRRVLALGTGGWGLLLLAHLILPEGAAETGVTATGATLLAVAHGLNRRRCCAPCSAPPTT